MKASEGVLATGAGLVGGTLLGSLLLAPAPADVPLWGSTDMSTLTPIRERLEKAGMTVTLTGLRDYQMTATGIVGTLYFLLVKPADFDAANAIATEMMATLV